MVNHTNTGIPEATQLVKHCHLTELYRLQEAPGRQISFGEGRDGMGSLGPKIHESGRSMAMWQRGWERRKCEEHRLLIGRTDWELGDQGPGLCLRRTHPRDVLATFLFGPPCLIELANAYQCPSKLWLS